MDITSNWDWPQWTILIMLFLSLTIAAANHGKQKLQSTGDEKGQPERHNGLLASIRFGLWVFILICGGFFR